MKIDLRTVPTYWNTIEKNTDRHARMNALFEKVGATNTFQLDGEMTTPYTKGIARSHMKSLEGSLPILVLEDDCALTEDWTPIIEVPDEADAIYLGTSWYGMVRGASQFRGCISSSYNDQFNRVYNMLGIHAVLYLTERYRSHVVGLLDRFQENPGNAGCDECIALTMKDFMVLAPKKPMLYQDDGHSNIETATPLNPYF